MKNVSDVITTSNVERKLNQRLLAAVLLLAAAVFLSGCGRNRVVSTEDDSADYKSARALPPLKKTIPKAPEVSPEVDSAPLDPAPIAAQETGSELDVDPIVEPELAAQDVVVQDTVLQDSATEENDVEEVISESGTSSETSIAVIGNKAKLIIDRDLDSAWGLLTESLTNSEVTVFSRNKAAGRISIGCAEIGNEAEGAVRRAGGWSIFTRKKPRASEYCSLQTQEKRGQTLVKVLDRAGEEVSAEYGRPILERVINN